MDRLIRRRVVSGLLGLLALGLSFAEAGAASLCDPSMPMQQDGEVAASHAGDMAGHPTAADPGAPGLSEEGADPPPCPWMPMMGSGCTAPAVAPAVSTGFGTVDGCSVVGFRVARDLTSLYASDPLLPPPRA